MPHSEKEVQGSDTTIADEGNEAGNKKTCNNVYIQALIYYNENINRFRRMLHNDAIRSCAAISKSNVSP